MPPRPPPIANTLHYPKMNFIFSSLRFACVLRRETASAMLGASWPPNSWPAGFDRHRVGPTFVRESEVGSIISRNPTTRRIITKPFPSESEDFIFGGWGGGGWRGTNWKFIISKRRRPTRESRKRERETLKHDSRCMHVTCHVLFYTTWRQTNKLIRKEV